MSIRKCTNDENEFLNRVFHKERPNVDAGENYEWKVMADDSENGKFGHWCQAIDDEERNIIEDSAAEIYVDLHDARSIWGGEIVFDEHSITENDEFTALHARILEVVLCDMGYMATYKNGHSENVGRIIAEDLEDAIRMAKEVYSERSEDENNREYFAENDDGIGWCKPVWYKNKEDGTVLVGTMSNGVLSLEREGRQVETPDDIKDEDKWEYTYSNCHACPFLAECQAFDEHDYSI